MIIFSKSVAYLFIFTRPAGTAHLAQLLAAHGAVPLLAQHPHLGGAAVAHRVVAAAQRCGLQVPAAQYATPAAPLGCRRCRLLGRKPPLRGRLLFYAILSAAAAAAAKSLQSCPTLCDPIDGSPPDPRQSLGFSRQEHWSGLPFPSPMHESEK